jgi:AraC-like DNA-binding protein
MHVKTYRRLLGEAVKHSWLSCLQEEGQWHAVLAEPPFNLPEGTGLHYHPGTPLSARNAGRTQGTAGYTRNWPHVGMHNSYAPYMGFLMDGEMDLRVGITYEAARQLKGECARSDYALLALQKNSFFLFPPGVPHGKGLGSPWERESSPPLAMRIFWIHFFSPGVLCHMSWNSQEGYVSKGGFFVADPHLLPAVHALTAELRLRANASTPIIHSLLLFIGHSIERDLHKLLTADVAPMHPEAQAGAVHSQIVEQACAYIDAHYKEHLNVAQIAANSFVSPSHLSRLFKTIKGVTISDYLTGVRLGYARSLLEETRLGIATIGQFVGYPNRAHFCQIFTRHNGCSPAQYRKEHNP